MPEKTTPERTNQDRVLTAEYALATAARSRGGELIDRDSATDLISDLLHWLDAQGVEDAESYIHAAIINWTGERNEK